MSLMRMPYTTAGQFITGLTTVAFFIVGCESVNFTLPPFSSDDAGDGYGVIVNTDPSKDLIGGVRLKTGEASYLFGKLHSNGTVAEVDASVFRNAAGQQATLFFESGRPSRAVGFDGATLDITYEQADLQRLKGQAVYTPAGGNPLAIYFDIDLEKTAEQVADTVERLTGIEITREPPPDETDAARFSPTARTFDRDGEPRSLALGVILVPVAIAVTGFTITLTLSQVLDAFVNVGNSLVIAFLSPFILMGNLMRSAMGLPLVTVEYGSQGPNINIPRPWDP